MLRSTRAILCYTDHSALYKAKQPRRPCAAFTGLGFPEHVTLALEGASRNAGYKSPYWITKAAARQHRVPIRQGQTGTGVCMDASSARPTELYHAEHIADGDITSFMAEFPLPGKDVHFIGTPPPPDAHVNQPHNPWLFRNDKWRRVSHLAAVQAMRSFRNTHGLISDIWLSVDTVKQASLAVRRGAFPIPIHEQPATLFYNVEQTTLPADRFAPPYNVPGHGMGRAATAGGDPSGHDFAEGRREAGAAAAQAMQSQMSRIGRKLQPKLRRPEAQNPAAQDDAF